MPKKIHNLLPLLTFAVLSTLILAKGAVSKELPAQTTGKCKYMGNIYSRKYHELSCPYAEAMTLWRRKYYETKRSCQAEGLRPCRFCLPARTKSVKAKILY